MVIGLNKSNKKQKAKIVVCSTCKGWGWGKHKRFTCPVCQGKGVWLDYKGGIYYCRGSFSGTLPSYRANIRLIPVAVRTICFTILCFGILIGIRFSLIHPLGFWSLILVSGISPLFFWIGLAAGLYLLYYFTVRERAQRQISFSYFGIFLNPKVSSPRSPVNIADFISPRAKIVLEDALDLAYTYGQVPHPLHLLKSLFSVKKIEQTLIRLEIKPNSFEKEISKRIARLAPNEIGGRGYVLSPSLKKILLLALEESLILGAKSISENSLFLALIRAEETNQLFKNREVEPEDARNIVLWLEAKVFKPRFFLFRRKRPRKIEHRIMNRAWTARQTPTLDRFSRDFTDLARMGLLGSVVGRERELNEVIRILARTTKNNVLLIGEAGSGRTTIVKALARKIVKNEVIPSVADKRVVRLDAGAVVAGVRAGGGLEERLLEILNEIRMAGNIILFIPGIHNLAEAGKRESFNAAEILTPAFSEGTFQVIGTTNFLDYHRSIERRADFRDIFEKVFVEEISEEEALQVLASQAVIIEEEEGVTLTFGAIKKAVELSKRYIPDKLLPGKAMDLLAETAVVVRSRGRGALVRDEDIMEVITEKTGIPLTKITATESQRLLNLEDEIHQRIIDQTEAVKAVSEAIRRVRVGLKREQKPVGTFLFLGPTGVGKTELAKALTEAYFGHERAMIRLDMSEFQTIGSINRLIGSPPSEDSAGMGGRLTEAVKRKPFSLILLDEFEKSNRDVVNLFLQVFDDGRLTDGLGRTVDFTNTIIIATSNVGSKIIQEHLKTGKSIEELRPKIEKILLDYFRPELLNRFTAKIIFKALSGEDIKAIARLQLKRLSQRLEEAQGIALTFTEEAVEKIAKHGYSSTYGARFLQRLIEKKVENFLAEKILRGEVKRGEKLCFDASDMK